MDNLRARLTAYYSGRFRSLPPVVRYPLKCVLSLASLIIPAALTAAFLGRPHLGPLIRFSFVLDIAAVAWFGGFWAGILVSAATIPVATLLATGGKLFLPHTIDPGILAVLFLVVLVPSQAAAARKRIESMLRAANQDLDRRVRERTRELEHSRESLQITLASIGDAVIATGTDGRIALMNGVAESLTGWSAAEAVGQPLDQVFVVVNAESRAAVESPVAKVLRTGASAGMATHTILVGRNGREIPIDDSSSPIRTASGEVAGIVLTFRDISERYRAEAERMKLLDADERLVGILTNINDGFLTVDRQWRHTFLNRKACELVHRRSEEILGATLWETLPGMAGTAAYPELQRAMRENAPVRCEFQYDPLNTWFELCAYPNRDGLALLMRDITHSQRLEGQLRQAQKMEAVGRLAGGIAHDFNNLLTVINGYAELAQMELPTDLPLRGTINEILNAGRRAAELTNGLLAFSRQQIRQPAILSLNDTVRGTEKMLRRLVGEDIEMVTVLAADLCPVEADRGQVEQIIVNLAVNARDAMPLGGILTLETSNTEFDEAYSSEHLDVPPGEYVMLAVSDTGQGMDAATQARIFEPFFTTKGIGKGTGLGLATVYGIVKQSGGSISVYSEPAHGTAFKLFFPRAKQSVVRAPPETVIAAPRRRPFESQAILLVEDEDSVRRLTSTMLERHGFRVLPARSGAEALSRCRAENGAIELVLSDMVMPQMSGDQLAQELRRQYPKLKFLFMSGYTEHAIVNQVSTTPGVSFISKPFTAAALIGKINQALGTPEQAAGNGI